MRVRMKIKNTLISMYWASKHFCILERRIFQAISSIYEKDQERSSEIYYVPHIGKLGGNEGHHCSSEELYIDKI